MEQTESDSWCSLSAGLAGTVAGAALVLLQARLWPAWLAGACAAAGALLLLLAARGPRRLAGWKRSALAFVACLLLGLAAASLRAHGPYSQRMDPGLDGRDLQVVGVVGAMPQRSDGGLRFLFELEAPEVPRLVLVSWWVGDPAAGDATDLPAVHAGERWRLTLRLRTPHGLVNPHGFDQELWLREQGIQATATVRLLPGEGAPRLLAATWGHPVERLRQTVRDAIFERVSDARQAGVIAALVTGDQRAIDHADWDVFRATGVAHLMSISGLHVTLFAWLAAALVREAWRRSERLCLRVPAQHAGLVGGVALAASYSLFSGWGVPAQRTVLMLAAVGLLRLAGLRWPWPVVWLLAAAVVVAIDPLALLQAGFWLSFFAVGLLFAGMGAAPQAGSRPGLWGRALALLREQSLMTLGLAPLTLLLFGQVSLVGLVANLLAIPWVTLVLTPLAMAGAVLPVLWQLAALAVGALMAVLEPMAGLPGAVWTAPAPPLPLALCAMLGAALICLRLTPGLRVLGMPLLMPVLLWQPPRPPPGAFELLAADVGQGTAVIVRTAGHSLLYDAGPRWAAGSDAGRRVLVPLLRALGERPDRLVISHRDTDHIGGAQAVLQAHAGAQLWSSIGPDHPLAGVRPPRRCEAGQQWDWDGVRFEFLHPQAGDYGQTLRSNAMSCVLRISAGSVAALLTGDIEQAQEKRLVSDGAPLRADWLMVPHHGSRTSSTPALLDAVRPRIAMVQAGWRNRFGHPSPVVLERYRARGITVAGSPECGAARWSSADPGRVVCERERDPHWWWY